MISTSFLRVATSSSNLATLSYMDSSSPMAIHPICARSDLKNLWFILLRVLSVFCYSVNSALHAWHLPFSVPIMPIIKIFPIVPHLGHKPVVMFFGLLALGFTVFLLTIDSWSLNFALLSLSVDRITRGEWDSNPRVLTDMGLAIPRPTRLGDPRTRCAQLKTVIITLDLNQHKDR